jgi:hypothetical protein
MRLFNETRFLKLPHHISNGGRTPTDRMLEPARQHFGTDSFARYQVLFDNRSKHSLPARIGLISF